MPRERLKPHIEDAQPWALERLKPICATCKRPVRRFTVAVNEWLGANEYHASCCGVSRTVTVPWAMYDNPAFVLNPGEFPGPAAPEAPADA